MKQFGPQKTASGRNKGHLCKDQTQKRRYHRYVSDEHDPITQRTILNDRPQPKSKRILPQEWICELFRLSTRVHKYSDVLLLAARLSIRRSIGCHTGFA